MTKNSLYLSCLIALKSSGFGSCSLSQEEQKCKLEGNKVSITKDEYYSFPRFAANYRGFMEIKVKDLEKIKITNSNSSDFYQAVPLQITSVINNIWNYEIVENYSYKECTKLPLLSWGLKLQIEKNPSWVLYAIFKFDKSNITNYKQGSFVSIFCGTSQPNNPFELLLYCSSEINNLGYKSYVKTMFNQKLFECNKEFREVNVVLGSEGKETPKEKEFEIVSFVGKDQQAYVFQASKRKENGDLMNIAIKLFPNEIDTTFYSCPNLVENELKHRSCSTIAVPLLYNKKQEIYNMQAIVMQYVENSETLNSFLDKIDLDKLPGESLLALYKELCSVCSSMQDANFNNILVTHNNLENIKLYQIDFALYGIGCNSSASDCRQNIGEILSDRVIKILKSKHFQIPVESYKRLESILCVSDKYSRFKQMVEELELISKEHTDYVKYLDMFKK